MTKKSDNYISALSHDWLTPFYDSLIRWTMPEQAFKRHLIEQTRLKSGMNRALHDSLRHALAVCEQEE